MYIPPSLTELETCRELLKSQIAHIQITTNADDLLALGTAFSALKTIEEMIKEFHLEGLKAPPILVVMKNRKSDIEYSSALVVKDIQILIVDDGEVNLMGTGTMVRALGYIAHESNSGQDALDRLKVHSYGAILMDLQMPDMNGFECTRKIRMSETGSDSHVSIIAFSGMPEADVFTDCINAGMDAYLSKACSSRELAATLKKFAGGLPDLPR